MFTAPSQSNNAADASHDYALITRIARGEEAALRQFYDIHQARVYRYAYARLNDSFAAADILNETMLEVWRQAVKFAGRSKASTWVLGIARHKVIDHQRRLYRHPTEEFDEATADPYTPDTADAIAGLQEGVRLRRCLEKLSQAHREVIHLAFFEDLAYGEIAAIAGCPEGTVKTRVYHAKQALKGCLGQRG